MTEQTPKTQDEARQYAIDYQYWASEQDMSYGELAAWQDHLHSIALQFDLIDEFKENGII